jgi:hypothetical protein
MRADHPWSDDLPKPYLVHGTPPVCLSLLITAQNGIGIMLVIVGSFLYSYVRYLEMKK